MLMSYTGVCIYRKHYGNPFVVREILDTVMHDGISGENTLVLNPDSHVVRLQETQTDIFKRGHASLVPLQWTDGSDNGDSTMTIPAKDLIESIRVVDCTNAMPAKLQKLLDETLPERTEQPHKAVFSSAADRATSLRKVGGSHNHIANVSLGCDGIFVVGSDSDDSSDEPQPAAIHLRSGDVLMLSGTNASTWYGLARVLEGTSQSWEQSWPCWQLQGGPPQFQGLGREGMDFSWKGCMKGKRIDLCNI
jgi:hypothetical protein